MMDHGISNVLLFKQYNVNINFIHVVTFSLYFCGAWELFPLVFKESYGIQVQTQNLCLQNVHSNT